MTRHRTGPLGRIVLAAAGAVLIVTAAHAQTAAHPHKAFPDVADGSYTDSRGERVLRLAIDIPAPRAAVWRAFSTGEGYRTWATPVARVDLKVGGMIETSYDAGAKFGDPQNIKNQILAFEAGRTMVFRNVQAPDSLPGHAEFGQIVSVAQFEDAGPGVTRVTLSSIGYRSGEPFDTLYKHFSWGNAYSLVELKQSFVKGPVDWAARAAQEKAEAAAAKVTAGR